MHLRIGELLRRLVPMTAHDVDEVLQEQRGTPRRFGEVAISLGLCRPEHVWKAWATQTSDTVEKVDLNVVGIDAQATAKLSSDVAMRSARSSCAPARISSSSRPQMSVSKKHRWRCRRL